MMSTKLKSRLVIVLILLTCALSFQGTVFAEVYEEYDQDDEALLVVDENSMIEKAISTGKVTANRKSSTKITYTLRTSFNPIPDSVSVKVWKCTYSSTSGTWVPQGSAQNYSYGRVSNIAKSGEFTVTAGKNYKVKVHVTEKKNGKSNNKVFYSSSV